MADFNSKYTGQEVENLLDQIANGNTGGGGITSETDPIFSASPAFNITDEDIDNWNGKQDVISDLATIRSGASKGATAVQPSSLASVATSGDYNDLNNKPTTPTKLSQLTNDKGFITTNDVKASVWECPLEGEIGEVLFETDDQDTIELLSEWIGELNNQRPCVLMYDLPYGYAVVQDFKHHATYGSNMCRFSYVYNGYIYEVEYDNVNLPVTFTIVNKLKLSDTHKQDKLVSGTSIKTINGESLLGSGNITIEGGSGGESYAGNYPCVYEVVGEGQVILQPNTYYILEAMSDTEIALAEPTNTDIVNEYVFALINNAHSGDSSIALPEDVYWVNGTPIIGVNETLEVSIVDYIALWIKY